MAKYSTADRKQVEHDAMRRALGFEPVRDPKNKAKGTRNKKPQTPIRRTSNETRQL